LGGGGIRPKGVPFDLPYLQEVSVSLGLGLIPEIKAVLNPPHHEAQKILDSPLLEWVVNTIEVQLGYSAGGNVAMSPVFVGTLLKPDIELGEEITITLNAQGVGGFAFLRSESRKVYKKKARIDIIRELLRGFDTKEPRAIKIKNMVKSGSESDKKLKEKISFSQAGKSDFLAVSHLLNDCKCWSAWEGVDKNDKGVDIFVIYSREERMKQIPSRIFSFFEYAQGNMGPNAGAKAVYPILGLSSPTSAIYLPGAAKGIASSNIDSKTRKAKVEVITDKTAKEPRVGTGGGEIKSSKRNPKVDEKTGEGAFHIAVEGNDFAKAALEGEFSRMSQAMGITLEIDSVGIPDLLPGEVITTHGLGQKRGLSGNYSVMKLNHTWGTSGSSTNFECVSNTAKLFKDVIKAFGPTNTKDPKDSGGGAKEAQANKDPGEQSG
jgi:hypothetical protein